MSVPSSVRSGLMKSLYKARKKIKDDTDIYLNSEHKELCDSYKKYQELSKEFSYSKTKQTYNTFKIKSHILGNEHNNDSIEYTESTINFDLLYNKYNSKFINKLYVKVNPDIIQRYIICQNNFLKSLTSEEIYTLRCHTHDGDVIINYFIKN